MCVVDSRSFSFSCTVKTQKDQKTEQMSTANSGIGKRLHCLCRTFAAGQEFHQFSMFFAAIVHLWYCRWHRTNRQRKRERKREETKEKEKEKEKGVHG